ncbi:type I phosphomannose isomerase catalytic subunit [Thermicanus aegyptius]|uniref:type I phosphomannose isomerase catalytic subunit n=1 Tax=Thermicanus aegyptius TaxID=94009 RepID=UPI00041CDFC3|nr:type I phosphomannose isomerase catalytic subunit [Thermicanus aegyptius]
MDLYPVKFAPIPHARIWGGESLKTSFSVQEKGPIGEYWVLSAHPSSPSVVTHGLLKGKSLLSLTEEYPKEFLGSSPQPRFPLLIKFLDVEDDLSIQVHPDNDYALREEKDYGKTEAWYFLNAKKGAKIIFGDTFQNREEYLKAVEEGRIRDYLKYKDVKAGDVVYVPAGTLHALLAGTQLIEVQQTSDVTYRVYDWDRVDQGGKKRELHVEKAAAVMTYGKESGHEDADLIRRVIRDEEGFLHEHLVTSPYFVMEKITLRGKKVRLSGGKEGNPDILIISSGEGRLSWTEKEAPISLHFGDTLLIPSSISQEGYDLETSGTLEILRTFY